jgi:outer membrane protein assembly factor BamD (BamD/ComL family)
VVKITETLPHSGIFTGTAPSEKYGDVVVFSYRDDVTLPSTPARTLCTTGTVFRGSDGSVRMFSKRFRDADAAVLIQFRLAECLFEQAKEHRKLKRQERSSESIAEGKRILEEALKNYPDSIHVAQGEYLLANLYQELATEKKDAKDMAGATPLYTEALARFSSILSTWPDSPFAARSQYHKALCLEMLGDYPRASEEYVKMTYLYPESELVGDATIRLATYYYKEAKRYDISARIYENFQRRFPTHEKAARALFMSGQCYYKQGDTDQEEYELKAGKNNVQMCASAKRMYALAVKAFAGVADKYQETATPQMRAQALYWAGDTSFKSGNFQQAYFHLKRTVFEYPETEWARRARGLLLQEARRFEEFE